MLTERNTDSFHSITQMREIVIRIFSIFAAAVVAVLFTLPRAQAALGDIYETDFSQRDDFQIQSDWSAHNLRDRFERP